MVGFLYILKCSDNTFYTGSTIHLEQRILEHKLGKGANYTRCRRPLKLVFYQKFSKIEDAFYFEKRVQKWSQAKKEALIQHNYHLLPQLSECKNESHFRNNNKLRPK